MLIIVIYLGQKGSQNLTPVIRDLLYVICDIWYVNPNLSSVFSHMSLSTSLSLYQHHKPDPNYPFPAYSILFQPIPTYSILFQPTPAYSSLFEPMAAYAAYSTYSCIHLAFSMSVYLHHTATLHQQFSTLLHTPQPYTTLIPSTASRTYHAKPHLQNLATLEHPTATLHQPTATLHHPTVKLHLPKKNLAPFYDCPNTTLLQTTTTCTNPPQPCSSSSPFCTAWKNLTPVISKKE